MLKILAAALWSLICYLPLEVTNLVLRPWPRRRAAVQAFFQRRWGRILAWILGARIERHGPLPEPPFLLVANHLTYVDIALLAETGGCFVAKAEIRGWPAMGRVCAAAGVIFVDRATKRDLLRVGQRIERAMEDILAQQHTHPAPVAATSCCASARLCWRLRPDRASRCITRSSRTTRGPGCRPRTKSSVGGGTAR